MLCTSKTMWNNFLERDSDITSYDEWHYIFICLRELIDIINFHIKNGIVSRSRRLSVQFRDIFFI
jgi:hypothetical protein